MRRLNAEMDAENDPGRLVALDLQFHAVFRALAGEVLRDLLDGSSWRSAAWSGSPSTTRKSAP